MSSSINSISPTFRDYLLLKNLVTDTVVNNGLESLLSNVGYPASIETLPNAVQPSSDVVGVGSIFQELNTILNTYQGNTDDYNQVNIILNPLIGTTSGALYTNSNDILNSPFINNNGETTNSDSIRQSLTVKNIYVDVPKQSVINLNTQPVPTYQNLTSYIDENNNLNIGGPSTNASDVISSLSASQGFNLNIGNNALIPNNDIKSTLLGRVLGANGVINDTSLGNIGAQQLSSHIGYNAVFGLQQETIGKINLNPLTLLQGKPLIRLNYSITVPKGAIGKILNFAANVLGVQSPVSLLEESSSIFTFSNKLIYIGQGNIERANEMIKNSGRGQVQSLMDHMRANLMISNAPGGKTLRQGYAPGYKDGRKSKGEKTGDGTNSNLYARANKDGGIIDFLNGKENSPISSGNYERSKNVSDDGWSINYFGVTKNSAKDGKVLYKNAFGWQDFTYNKDNNTKVGGDKNNFFQTPDYDFTLNSPTLPKPDGGIFKKTLLSKTEELFNSNKMRTLVSGNGVRETGKSQINSAVSRVGNYTSKGSGVMSEDAIINGADNGPENVFCRTWTTYDRYAQVLDLQKHRGLYPSNKNILRQNTENSVLENNGFVRISPNKTDKLVKPGVDVGAENKRYMFSIENLAWNDNLVNLLPCEVGPGDTLSDRRGRIMWFPPYDITFTESTSASWDKHNFIGRGEPMYTYNNTERSGNLSWKIIIDHPNYLNFIGKNEGVTSENFDEYLASFFAGCTPLLTPNEQAAVEKIITEVKPVLNLVPEIPPASFNVYFPNDVYDVDKYPDYEICVASLSPSLELIGHKDNISFGKFNENGDKIITASNDDTAKIWDESGTLLLTLYTNGNVNYAEFNFSNTHIVTASSENKANVWDESGTLLYTLTHGDSVFYAKFNSIWTKIVTASADFTAKIWDNFDGTLLFTLTHDDIVNYAEFNDIGDKIITASYDKTAKIWDEFDGTLLFTLTHDDIVNYAKFNYVGTKIVTASADFTAKIWDSTDGALLFTLTDGDYGITHSDIVNYAEFSHDGTKVVTASNDKTAKIWDVNSGTLLKTLNHTDIVNYAKFNYNGDKVVTSSADFTAKVWSVETDTPPLILKGNTSGVNYAEFSPDGNSVVGVSYDLGVIWNVNTDSECKIDYSKDSQGTGFGIGDYTEMCYQYGDTWSSEVCRSNALLSQGDPGRVQNDGNNFGLNGVGTMDTYQGTRIGDKKYKSWRDPQYATDLKNYLLNTCKTCKVNIVGFASNQGGDSRNEVLAQLRAENMQAWLYTNILTEPEFTGRISVKSEGGVKDENCTLKSKTDNYYCKADRYVTVKFVPTAEDNVNTGNESSTNNSSNNNRLNIPVSRFYTECDYFEKLEQDSPIAYNTIKEKIKYFQPAFHSTTPEGFNSRLNFLQQCMRQGPTNGVTDNNNPNNLAFGRPPVCILRIGDFYHTKIIIENLNFSFEPLVWDLNPEGVGVQPMICNVDMSFAFIGGSSLNGPINKLQNAVSFNYYANTEIYDTRADDIKIKDGSGTINPGEKSISAYINTLAESQDANPPKAVANQITESANANSGANAITIPINDEEIFKKALKDKTYLFYGVVDSNNPDLKQVKFLMYDCEKLSKEYNATLHLKKLLRYKDVIKSKLVDNKPDDSDNGYSFTNTTLIEWKKYDDDTESYIGIDEFPGIKFFKNGNVPTLVVGSQDEEILKKALTDGRYILKGVIIKSESPNLRKVIFEINDCEKLSKIYNANLTIGESHNHSVLDEYEAKINDVILFNYTIPEVAPFDSIDWSDYDNDTTSYVSIVEFPNIKFPKNDTTPVVDENEEIIALALSDGRYVFTAEVNDMDNPNLKQVTFKLLDCQQLPKYINEESFDATLVVNRGTPEEDSFTVGLYQYDTTTAGLYTYELSDSIIWANYDTDDISYIIVEGFPDIHFTKTATIPPVPTPSDEAIIALALSDGRYVFTAEVNDMDNPNLKQVTFNLLDCEQLSVYPDSSYDATLVVNRGTPEEDSFTVGLYQYDTTTSGLFNYELSDSIIWANYDTDDISYIIVEGLPDIHFTKTATIPPVPTPSDEAIIALALSDGRYVFSTIPSGSAANGRNITFNLLDCQQLSASYNANLNFYDGTIYTVVLTEQLWEISTAGLYTYELGINEVLWTVSDDDIDSYMSIEGFPDIHFPKQL